MGGRLTATTTISLVVLLEIVLLRASTSPWQQSIGRHSWKDESARYSDMPTTVFAPGGRLYSVEKAVSRASDRNDLTSNLVVAIRCREGVVVVSTLGTSPYLIEATCEDSTNTNKTNEENQGNHVIASSLIEPTVGAPYPPFCQLAPKLFGVTGGSAAESQILRKRLQMQSEAAWRGSAPLQASVLARIIADDLQVPTQQGGKGPILACTLLILSATEIWRIDPTGQFWKCFVAFAGRDAPRAEGKFMELLRMESKGANDVAQLSQVEALILARKCISSVFVQVTDTDDFTLPLGWAGLSILKSGVRYDFGSEL